MKKLINDPSNVVAEALHGIEAAHPDLLVDHQHKIIYRGDAPRRDKVGIISGGGSGHEPLHGGFVGLGMLDAACAGEVFTSGASPQSRHGRADLPCILRLPRTWRHRPGGRHLGPAAGLVLADPGRPADAGHGLLRKRLTES